MIVHLLLLKFSMVLFVMSLTLCTYLVSNECFKYNPALLPSLKCTCCDASVFSTDASFASLVQVIAITEQDAARLSRTDEREPFAVRRVLAQLQALGRCVGLVHVERVPHAEPS